MSPTIVSRKSTVRRLRSVRRSSGKKDAQRRPRIDNYHLIRVIGKGAYGTVWLAKSTVADNFCAIKIVQRLDDDQQETLERELNGLKEFCPNVGNHPSLMPILHTGRSRASELYYVMPLADPISTCDVSTYEGYVPHSLAAMIRAGPVPLDQGIALTLRLLEGLQSLHAAKLVHRDIKPGNVVFCNGHPVLADIGLVTKVGEVSRVGSEYYMPTEGLGKPSADLFALGKLLYVMVSSNSIEDFPELPSFRTDDDQRLYRDLNRILLKACAKDPAKRYGSAESMSGALQGLVVSTTRRQRPEAHKMRVPRRRKDAVVRPYTKSDLKKDAGEAIDQEISRIRIGYPHNQQFLTATEMRKVTGCVRGVFRTLLGRVPGEITDACRLAEAVLEPSAFKRRDLLELAFGMRGYATANLGEDRDDSGPWLLGVTGRLAAESLGAAWATLVKPLTDLAAVAWYVGHFGRLQADPDKATKVALEYLNECVDQAIEDGWPEYGDEIG